MAMDHIDSFTNENASNDWKSCEYCRDNTLVVDWFDGKVVDLSRWLTQNIVHRFTWFTTDESITQTQNC